MTAIPYIYRRLVGVGLPHAQAELLSDTTTTSWFDDPYVPEDATETTTGVVELATRAESVAGTSDTRVVTPHGLADAIEDAAMVGVAVANLAGGATLPTVVTKVNELLASLRAAGLIEV